ncbi:hypothetical protein GOP47_0003748 [Adiantum capillus-veneris]|uniref:C2 domain-containing protein n=1 Tax=Adiantum capillus-veneris TaxID=13818 RepID=A0A9D4V673_ADICA|nr:hypothetical protein GOP47_0003748 [Adiantum capillus-veneris]
MGACFSDTGGGRQSVGVANEQKHSEGDAFEAVNALHGTRGLASQIELSVSASKLRDRDVLSKSDPMLVLFLKRKDGTFEEIGRTEVCLNSLSPKWITKLLVLYSFEDVQVLLFKIYDIDTNFKGVPTKKIPLQQQQFLGQVECVLSQIVTTPGQSVTRALQPSKEQELDAAGMPELGSLTVRAEEVVHSKSIVEIRVNCLELDNKDLFSKSDPYLSISKRNEDGSYTPVYKTEVKKNSLNPIWKPIKITLQQLCNGDMDCPLKFECLNFNASGRHDLIGALQTSLTGIQKLQREDVLNLEQQSSGRSAIKVGGKIQFQLCNISVRPSFLDYIFSGFELSFFVAVDFTASNGVPSQRDSLHYVDPVGRLNAYQSAICAVGEVLEYYDTDKRFSVWGFGGRSSPQEPVSHCFNLSEHAEEVLGVAGILEAYSQGIHRVRLAGPTIFGPVIEKASSIAKQAKELEQQKYFVLLIITDGVITDLQESINALVIASGFPLSVLIVGVGGADFTEMEHLDADRGRLQTSNRSRAAVRDIVQFVPLRNATGAVSISHMLLAELPSQFLEYMALSNLLPT